MLKTTLLVLGAAVGQAESASWAEVMEVFAVGFAGVFVVLGILTAGIRISGMAAARLGSKETK